MSAEEGTLDLARRLIAAAVDSGVTIGVAESCTGGMVAAALTDVPGSSVAFVGGVVAYSNAVKLDVLGVGAAVLAERGAVSGETAAQMARAARAVLGTDLAVSVTGIAGPEGGTEEKPVGTVWFGASDREGTLTSRRLFDGDRAAVRRQATVAALELLGERVEALRSSAD